MLYEAGLAYQAESMVNYDPVDKTVLANEQVDANGCSWRSGAKVQQLRLKQWFLKISHFREALLDDLEILSQDNRWPERVVSMQKNWIGKSQGSKIQFAIRNASTGHQFPPVEVFTTRVDTIHSVQYIALSLEHPIVRQLSEQPGYEQLQQFREEAARLPPDTKAGMLIDGLEAVNPIDDLRQSSEAPRKPVSVFVAPYVRGDYGTGAVMGVPGHDTRDFAFWKLNAGDAPVLSSVAPTDAAVNEPSSVSSDSSITEPYTDHGRLTSTAAPFDKMTTVEAIPAIVNALSSSGHEAELTTSWRLRDWLISRQRYWGTPIPIIHCKSCGPVPVPASDLPVELPRLQEGQLRGRRGNPLESMDEWTRTSCPQCHRDDAKRETDTMDTFMDSSWYFFRFLDPKNPDSPFSPEAANTNMPVDLYIGGVEHAILHLLYSRFIAKFLSHSDAPLWPRGADPSVKGEPFRRLLTQGMVHGRTYSDPDTGRFLKPEEVDLSEPMRPKLMSNGKEATVSFEKMSKSKYNGVDASQILARYGADVVRSQILFAASPSDVLEWDEAQITGVQRWLAKIWKIAHNTQVNGISATTSGSITLEGRSQKELDLYRRLDHTVRSVSEAFSETFSLNTVVSDLMKLTNELDAFEPAETSSTASNSISRDIYTHILQDLLRMLAPVTPAFAEECWSILHSDKSSSIFQQSFPEPVSQEIHDKVLAPKTQKCAVQVNGKLKFVADIPLMPGELSTKSAQKSTTGLTAQSSWAIDRLMETQAGKEYFSGGTPLEMLEGIKAGKGKIVVVRGGKTVNFVYK
jgi:leucyl-tRNA synthetase